MHMDVKEPAKLGVRFNWCKCVSGGWQPSLHCDMAQAEREGSACMKHLHEAGSAARSPGVHRQLGKGQSSLATSAQRDRVMAKGQDRRCDQQAVVW